MNKKIRTNADRLVQYVYSNKEVSLEDASKAIGLSHSQTEKLSRTLEKTGLLETNYGLAGLKLAKPKRLRPKEKQTAAKPLEIEDTQGYYKIARAKDLADFFESSIEKRVEFSKRYLNELKHREFSEQELSTVKKEMQLALRQLNAFAQYVENLNAKKKHFLHETWEIEKAMKILEEEKIRKGNKAILFLKIQVLNAQSLLKKIHLNLFETPKEQKADPRHLENEFAPSVKKTLQQKKKPKKKKKRAKKIKKQKKKKSEHK
ncbi:MAG: hypothetical protein ACE5DI_02955 [Candidatus Micrarchaeia archaeon]